MISTRVRSQLARTLVIAWTVIASGIAGAMAMLYLGAYSDARRQHEVEARECSASFKFGLLDLESEVPSSRDRGRARLWTMFDLCFPADGDKIRPSLWMTQVDEKTSPAAIERVIESLRAGWAASEVGEPWRGPIP